MSGIPSHSNFAFWRWRQPKCTGHWQRFGKCRRNSKSDQSLNPSDRSSSIIQTVIGFSLLVESQKDKKVKDKSSNYYELESGLNIIIIFFFCLLVNSNRKPLHSFATTQTFTRINVRVCIRVNRIKTLKTSTRNFKRLGVNKRFA